jgi:integrase
MAMLLRDLLREYSRKRTEMEEKSVRLLDYSLNNFRAFLGREAEITDLSEEKILDHLRWNAAKRAAATANHHRGNLMTLWGFAKEMRLTEPPPKIGKKKEPHRDPVAWTLDEVTTLYEATSLLEGFYPGCPIPISLCWKIAIAICWDTAVRLEAIKEALMDDLDLKTGIWLCRAETIKGKHGDEIKQLHHDTLSIIQQSLWVPRKHIWPFPGTKDTATRHLGKLLRLAGLPDDRKHKFHCMRRTAESHAACKLGIEQAAAAVGHTPAVARKSYISQKIFRPPALIEGLPRPF